MLDEPSSGMNRRRFGQYLAGVAGLWGISPSSVQGEVDESVLPCSVHLVASVDDMKGSDPAEHELLYVRGYYHPGDGGDGLFKWVPGFERDPDGGITFASKIDSFGTGGTNEGRWVWQWRGEPLNVRWFGARGNLEWARNVSVSVGSRIATAQAAPFGSNDVGKSFVLNGTDGQVVASIRRVRDGSTVELDRESLFSIENMVASWGKDDASAFNRAIAFANPDPVRDGELVTHKEVPSYGIFVPDGDYLISTPIILREGATLIGASTMGTRLNLSYAENGGDHRIRSYFHSNKSAVDTGTHAEYQKNFGLEHLGLRPRPGERNPGENQKFVYIKFGIEFSVENVRISTHNSTFKGVPWHVVGVQLEKNVDPNFDRVNFESGQYGLCLVQPPEEVAATDRFGVRGGMFNNLYFYNQKRHSCVAEHVFNTRVMNFTCKYAQDYGYEDRTGLLLGPGRDGSHSRDVQFAAISVNGGYRPAAKLRHGMVLNGNRVQVTGGSVQRTDGTGLMGATITGISVAHSGGHGIEIRDEVTEIVVSSVFVTETQGHGVCVDGDASLVGVRGAGAQQGEVGGDGTVAGRAAEGWTAATSEGVNQRPANPSVGTTYFDITLGRPLWWDGHHWVDSDGTHVTQ